MAKNQNTVEESLEYILLNGYKADMLLFMNTHPEAFEELIQLALNNKKTLSPRAAWLLASCMIDNDSRVTPHIPAIVETLNAVPDGHKRDLLTTLRRMDLDEAYDGTVFDSCIAIWSKLNQIPSVRYNALRLALKIADSYPELLGELLMLTQDSYVESLSPGIKRSIQRMITDFSKKHQMQE